LATPIDLAFPPLEIPFEDETLLANLHYRHAGILNYSSEMTRRHPREFGCLRDRKKRFDPGSLDIQSGGGSHDCYYSSCNNHEGSF
jgi:hypothetical protein